jgi:hypothetical protein
MDKSELVERLTNQRLRLSEIRANLRTQSGKCFRLQYTSKGNFEDNPIIREIFEAERATNLAFMWLGKTKGFLGEEYPYKQSYDPRNKLIENPVDVAASTSPEYADPIEMLKSIRADFKKMDAEMTTNLKAPVSGPAFECLRNSFTYFQEACMWLGVALGNIHERGIENLAYRGPSENLMSTDQDASIGKDDALVPEEDLDKKKDLTESLAGSANTLSETSQTATQNETEGRTETDKTIGASGAGSQTNEISDQPNGGPGNSETNTSSGENGGREVLSSAQRDSGLL